jgi:hypothetical protein
MYSHLTGTIFPEGIILKKKAFLVYEEKNDYSPQSIYITHEDLKSLFSIKRNN